MPDVAPVWERGLKYSHTEKIYDQKSRSRLGAWIEMLYRNRKLYAELASLPFGSVD